jgi:DNA-directed RNA polymerase specialized sigma24 family protein
MGRQPDTRFIPEDAEIIRHKVRTLIGRHGFTTSDEPDLQQELAMHVSIRIARHDPSRAARSTFVDRIVRNKIANILEHRMAKKRGGRTRPAALDEVPEGLLLDGHADPEAVDLGLDVRNAVAGLSPDLQRIAALLTTNTPSEVARALGLTRGQFRQKQDAIRFHLTGEGLDPNRPEEPPTRRRSR